MADTPRADAAQQIITLEQLRAIMPNAKVAWAEAYLDPLNRAMIEYQITTRLRASAFVAQLAVESGELRYMEEIASGIKYDITVNRRKALKLGNVNPGDGKRYKGRGPIQLTGRTNYRRAGADLGLDLEGNPVIAASPKVAFRIAGWFWQTRKLNKYADVPNFNEVTRRINGGYTHLARRKKYYKRALDVLKGLP